MARPMQRVADTEMFLRNAFVAAVALIALFFSSPVTMAAPVAGAPFDLAERVLGARAWGDQFQPRAAQGSEGLLVAWVDRDPVLYQYVIEPNSRGWSRALRGGTVSSSAVGACG